MWGPVIELVDLRYRPEVNTIEALAESDPRKHAPLAEPIWTTTPEESGLGVGKTRSSQVKSSQVVGLRTRVANIRTLIFSFSHRYAGSVAFSFTTTTLIGSSNGVIFLIG